MISHRVIFRSLVQGFWSQLIVILPQVSLTGEFKASYDPYCQGSSKIGKDPFHIPIVDDLFLLGIFNKVII